MFLCFLDILSRISLRALEKRIMNSAPILAIQLCRFSSWGGQLFKDETLASCTQTQLGQ